MSNTASGAAQPPRERPEKGGGYFTIYKKGQGYWTRMGTAAAAALIGVLTAHFFYIWIPVWFTPLFDQSAQFTDPTQQVEALRAAEATTRAISIGVAAGFLLIYAFIIFKVMNRPGNADFLIATDGEMKKVNWATRKELVGSTRVVILFVFFLAAILFAVDLVFMTFFWWIKVLHLHPFFQS